MRSHGFRSSVFYQVWRNMMTKCYKDNRPDFKYYGGAGILVCERWHDIKNFIDDMKSTWFKGATIERIENHKGYFPANCRWATRKEQIRNRLNTIFIEIDGKHVLLWDFCKNQGINYNTIWRRIRNGWTIQKAISQPIRPIQKVDYERKKRKAGEFRKVRKISIQEARLIQASKLKQGP